HFRSRIAVESSGGSSGGSWGLVRTLSRRLICRHVLPPVLVRAQERNRLPHVSCPDVPEPLLLCRVCPSSANEISGGDSALAQSAPTPEGRLLRVATIALRVRLPEF